MSYALITGSAKRIGKELVIFLAKKGWNIIIHYNKSTNEVENVEKIITNLGRKCLVWKGDFSKAEFIDLNISNLPIGLLINNAATFSNDNLSEFQIENLLNNLNINFIHPALITKLILKNSSYKGQINVINMLDTVIYKLPKNFSSYYFSKKSLADFTKLAAKFYAPLARINGISLGQILKNDKQSQENFDKSLNNNPLGYNGTICEICSTVDFLLNTKSITGQIIALDGGSHLNNITYP